MNKKNLILLGVFAVLVLAAYLAQGPIKSVKEKMGVPKNFLAAIDADAISHIDIRDKEEEISLEKVGERWRIAGTREFYVRDEIMMAALSGFKEAQSAGLELVGENSDKKDEFDTGTTSGAIIVMRQGDVDLGELVIGKNGSDFTSTYISRPQQPETYLTPVNLRREWIRNDWYDLSILDLDKENIDYLRFQFPNREFIVQKEEKGWTGTSPYIFTVNSEKIEEILDRLSFLRAVSVPSQDFAGTGLEKNLLIVQIKGSELDRTLMLGDAHDSGDYYAKRADSDNIYLVNADLKEILDKQIRDLR